VTGGDAASISAALAGEQTMDASFYELVASLPRAVRPLARRLPHRLGLTRSRSGTFEDFVILDPNRNLPAYAAEDAAAPSGFLLDAGRVRLFRRAHNLGAFYWLLRDRLADEQVASDLALVQLGDLLFQRWAMTLEEATGDGAAVRALIDDATLRWRHGTANERVALERGSLTPAQHAAIVADKLDWITLAARALLLAAGQPERARLFARAYDGFLLGLQCIDDVSDEAEDRALHGHSVPSALGCSPGALLRAAPKLMARAAGQADEAGFARLESWLSTFAGAIAAWRLDGDPIADDLEAIGLIGELDREPDSAGQPPDDERQDHARP